MYGKTNQRWAKKLMSGIILLSIQGCGVPQRPTPPKITEVQKEEKAVEAPALQKLIDQLVSSNFFEYTQAARTLIEMGTPAIDVLYKNRHLLRESNETLIPVCLPIIQIIFRQQPVEWVTSQLKSPHREIRKMAQGELERRKDRPKE